jgi:alkylation response protein AidB-like acyl-CoA dehydrogenase
MDFSDSSEQAEFRAKVRKFFEDNLPQRYRENLGPIRPHTIRASNGEEVFTTHADWSVDRYSEDPEIKKAADDWSNAMAAEGYIASSWPKDLGGAGFTTIEQFIFNEERERATAPRVGGSGAMFLGSLLMVYGTEEQKAKWMPPIAAGKIDWAQGYSEPGSGSDLASLQCRAVRDGDEYVVNGQKLWGQPLTSDAMYTLVRTDPEAPKHKGISFLMIENLNDPGITMGQLPNMAFSYPGNGETFFQDVRVPVKNLVGEENQGWYVSMTLMDFDRGSLADTGEDRRALAELIEFVQTDEGKQVSRVSDLPSVRAEIVDRVVESRVGQNLARRVVSMQAAGLIPNYEASMGKSFSTELHQRRSRTGTKAFGLYANLWPGDERAPLRGEFTHDYAQTVAYTIYGGSSEIQRNVIATRGLGLPRG